MSQTPIPGRPERSTPTLLVATMFPQAVLSMMSLSPPVMARAVTAAYGLPAELTGLYTGLVYVFILVGNLLSAPLIARFGPLRLSLGCVVIGGAGLALFGAGGVAGLLVGTALIGLCYGPLTPASAQAISHRAGSPAFTLLVSVRQTSVPLGGVLAGWLVPALLPALGWRLSCVALGSLSALAGAAFVGSPPIRSERPRGRRRLARGDMLRPLRLIVGRPALLRLSCASLAFGALQLVLSTFFVVYLVGIVGHGLVAAGALLSANQLAGIVGRPSWGYVADRVRSPRLLLCLLGLGMAVSCLLTSLLASVGPSPAASLAVAILFGATASGWNGVFLAEIMREVAPNEAGLATSGGLLFTHAGVVLGPPLFGALAALVGLPGAFLAAAVLALAGAALALPHRHAGEGDRAARLAARAARLPPRQDMASSQAKWPGSAARREQPCPRHHPAHMPYRRSRGDRGDVVQPSPDEPPVLVLSHRPRCTHLPAAASGYARMAVRRRGRAAARSRKRGGRR